FSCFCHNSTLDVVLIGVARAVDYRAKRCTEHQTARIVSQRKLKHDMPLSRNSVHSRESGNPGPKHWFAAFAGTSGREHLEARRYRPAAAIGNGMGAWPGSVRTAW